MSASNGSEIKTIILPIAEIVPYWRNPRRISDEAVEAVMESIKKYGYQSPIVVDTENVIIMGHTRYSALRRLGVKEAPVIVAADLTPRKVKELRTIDNRTSENTRWDFERLMSELDELDQVLMSEFFPEVLDSRVEVVSVDESADDQVAGIFEAEAPKEAPEAEFICPECFHQWSMKVSKEDVFSGELGVKA